MRLQSCSLSNSNSIIPLQHILKKALGTVQAHAEPAVQVQENGLSHGKPLTQGCLQKWDGVCAGCGPCLSSAYQSFVMACSCVPCVGTVPISAHVQHVPPVVAA